MKEEFDYSPVAKEIGWNFDKVNYQKISNSGFNYYITVLKEINEKTKMLDIGCGCGEKSIKYFSLAKEVVMLDNEKEMLKKAKENAKKYYGDTKKFTFVLGDKNEKLDYPDEYFDLIVSRHCGANMDEVYRVLKKGGVFISEDYDEDDCLTLKQHFGFGQGYENYKNNIRENPNNRSIIQVGPLVIIPAIFIAKVEAKCPLMQIICEDACNQHDGRDIHQIPFP